MKKINDLEILILSCYSPLYSFDWCQKFDPSENLSETFILCDFVTFLKILNIVS